MIKGLPNFCGNEENTLFIIGNGFDLAHGIMSKYKHFYCWLIQNGHEELCMQLQKIFPELDNRIDCLWNNFESALEKPDYHFIIQEYIPYPNDGWDEIEWNKNIQIGENRVMEIIDKIPSLIKEWARDIDINVKPIFQSLSKKSKYLSFNYTLTLEKVYNISEKNVCHIHEKTTSKSKIIVGFDSPISINDFPARSIEEERAQEKFERIQNSLVKPKLQQIQKNKPFFSALSNINTVIVIGHSLSWVDLRYFSEVKQSIKKNAKWYFSIHDPEDSRRVQLFVKPAKLQPNYIQNYDFFDLS